MRRRVADFVIRIRTVLTCGTPGSRARAAADPGAASNPVQGLDVSPDITCGPRGRQVAKRNSRANDLLFYLRGRTTLCRQRYVGERRVMRGSMPMLLFRGNMNDIAWRDDLLLRFRRDDALAGGHK